MHAHKSEANRSRTGRRAGRIIRAWLKRRGWSDLIARLSGGAAGLKPRELHDKPYNSQVMLLRLKPRRKLPPKPRSGVRPRRAWQADDRWQNWRGGKSRWLLNHIRL